MASAFSMLVFFFIIFEAVAAQQKNPNLINLGSSLSPITPPTSWRSPSGRFAFGFYQQGSGFVVGIWLVGKSENTVMWTAYRDDPPVSSYATLELTKNGDLLLRTDQSKDKVLASTSVPASFASMLDSGNFVLYNKDSAVIWESFNHPTDTILGGQRLSTGTQLFSAASETNCSTGQYRLKMQDDGNAVLYPIHTLDDRLDAYWATNTWLEPQIHLYLNTSGILLLINNSNLVTVGTVSDNSALYNDSIIYSATLGSNGIFRLYSHYFDRKGEYNIFTEWSQPSSQCEVKGFCGVNSYCTLNDNQPSCRCLPGTISVDLNQPFYGCHRNFTKEWCKGVKENTTLYNIISMDKIMWDNFPYFKASMAEQDCKKSCLEDCNCEAALYVSGDCMKHKFPLKYASRDQAESSTASESSTAFFKVGMQSVESDNGTNPIQMKPTLVRITRKKSLVLILVIILGFVICSCVALSIAGFFFFMVRVLKNRMLLDSGSFGLTQELTLRAFSYNELKNATNGFKEELGNGSFGSVYKGTLYKAKKLVAVKRLEKVVTEGEREFHTEMLVIGRTHHKNLVRLLGYCAEGSKRLLVYEYMSNGSLADLLFQAERHPDWNERVKIALDVARGILYLHEECEAPIIHCDIKPQNILMDDFWTAKISDFGLAKLLMPDQTRTFTMVRGTRGYLAPEWQRNAPISVMVDVYSYGIVLLEIVCCRRNMDVNVPKQEAIFLSNWVYKCFIARELDKLVRGEEVDKKIFEKMVKVALWCIQDEPALRPSMKSVVMMLEGITDIAIPPCPSATSA